MIVKTNGERLRFSTKNPFRLPEEKGFFFSLLPASGSR